MTARLFLAANAFNASRAVAPLVRVTLPLASTDPFALTLTVTVSLVVSVFEPGTDKELTYMQQGEICISGPNIMLGYYDNESETKRLIKVHKDGKRWVHTGDLGYMAENGSVYILGRMKRLIIRHDGFKVFPSLIENVVIELEFI